MLTEFQNKANFSRHVFKTSWRRLQCNNFSSSRRLGRRKTVTLKTSRRCLQDQLMFDWIILIFISQKVIHDYWSRFCVMKKNDFKKEIFFFIDKEEKLNYIIQVHFYRINSYRINFFNFFLLLCTYHDVIVQKHLANFRNLLLQDN